MAYTKEMFLRDNYPEDYAQFLLVKEDYLQQGKLEGRLSEAREMVLEALNVRFSNTVPRDIRTKINTLNNRLLLKKLHRAALQSKDIGGFKKIIQEIPLE